MRIYPMLITLAAPLLALSLMLRVLRGREALRDLSERLGLRRMRVQGPVIWVHGASIGEITPVRAVLDELLQAHPEVQVILSSNSTTARDTVRGWGLERVHARLAPLDLKWLYAHVFAGLDLRAFVLLEGDLWPNRLLAAKAQAVPCMLLGGRVSTGSARIWARFDQDARSMMGCFDVIFPQDAGSATRLAHMGGQQIRAPLQLKSAYDATALPEVDAQRRARQWLAASTHEGEDETLLDAHAIARESLPGLRMILAPRHPERGDRIAALASARGLVAAQRSAGADLEAPCDVYIADTLGEMPLWYANAYACFVAGSLVPKGGHTPYEPAAYGAALIHGPFVSNFQPAYDILAQQQGALRASDAHEISNALILLSKSDTARDYGLRARAALSHRPTLQEVLNWLNPLVLSKNVC